MFSSVATYMYFFPELIYDFQEKPGRRNRVQGGSSMVLNALSCYLSFIMKHFDTKLDFKIHSRSKCTERLLCPRLDPPLYQKLF